LTDEAPASQACALPAGSPALRAPVRRAHPRYSLGGGLAFKSPSSTMK